MGDRTQAEEMAQRIVDVAAAAGMLDMLLDLAAEVMRRTRYAQLSHGEANPYAVLMRRVFNGDDLSTREREVLAAVAGGLTNAQAAKKLFVEEQTVKFHLTNVYRKLNVPNRAAATAWAVKHGLVTQHDNRYEHDQVTS